MHRAVRALLTALALKFVICAFWAHVQHPLITAVAWGALTAASNVAGFLVWLEVVVAGLVPWVYLSDLSAEAVLLTLPIGWTLFTDTPTAKLVLLHNSACFDLDLPIHVDDLDIWWYRRIRRRRRWACGW